MTKALDESEIAERLKALAYTDPAMAAAEALELKGNISSVPTLTNSINVTH